jgi:apolipoprotein N-acyltransferase
MSSTEGAFSRSARAGPALAALSGLLLALAYPRPALPGIGLVALVPFLFSCGGIPASRAILHGLICGGVFFAVLLYWIPPVMVVYGGLSWPLAIFLAGLLVGYLALYFAVFAWLLAAAWRSSGVSALLAAPVVWVGLELVRSRLITGFPWGLAGYSQAGNLPLLQAAALGGIYAVSFLVLAANAALALLLHRGAPRRARAAGGALLALVALSEGAGLLALRGGSDDERDGVKVAAIQGNVPEAMKWSESAVAPIIDDLERLTREAAQRGARLVVWPESASPLTFREPYRVPRGDGPESGRGGASYAVRTRQDYAGRVSGLARDLRLSLIAGSVDYEMRGGELVALNSAFAIDPGGVGPSYDKSHLVPFGEYVPLERVLFFVNRMVHGAIAGFAPGRRLEPLPTPLGRAATFICYEAIFPDLVRRLAARDAAILVNITNDAWFGQSAGPEQHLEIATVRAIENRRYLLRAANTGISAIVDPHGRIVARAALGTRAVLVGTIAPRQGRSLYSRTGDLLAWACAIVTVLQVAAAGAAQRRPG